MENRKSRKELEYDYVDGSGKPIYYYKRSPFTGIAFETYENGYQGGWIRYYFENGKLNQESKGHNNIEIDCTFKEWDIDGNLVCSF